MKPLDIYKMLYLIRRSEEFIITHYNENEMKTPMHMSMGEEAIVGGVVAALKKQDTVFGTYRSHALYLAKTGDINSFFAELYGKVTGSAHGKAGSMHLADPTKHMILSSAVVGTTIPVAVGAALSNKMQKKTTIVAVFFGDGAIDEGVFWESINFASLKKLPILFVCENNNLAIHSPVKTRHGYTSIEEALTPFNCHVANSTSTNVFEIYRITSHMLKKMKQTSKPGFLHFTYYRYLEHVGIATDFHFNYRSKKEFLKWKKVDPLLLSRAFLLELGIKEKIISQEEKRIDKQIAQSIYNAKKAPFPPDNELFSNIYD